MKNSKHETVTKTHWPFPSLTLLLNIAFPLA